MAAARKWTKGWDAAHEANRTHGMTGTRVFRIWTGMLARCQSPTSTSYPRYGGRGIKVCDRWQSFDLFLQDMGMPAADAQLDRIDTNGNYEPGNCRWVSVRENSLNRRTTNWIEHDGQRKCITEWAADLGVTRQALHRRINVLGWPLERALTERKSR